MLRRRQLFGFAGVAAVAAAGGAAWIYYESRRSAGLAAGPFRHYPFDPVAPENFRNKLFIPGTSGPFGVLDVTGPLRLRATQASFTLLPGKTSPFLLYQTEQAGKAYQNPILRIESGARFSASLDNALPEPTIIHWHGLHTPANMDGHPSNVIAPSGRYDYDFMVRDRGGTYWYHTHAHELTAKQAYHGLASFFLVEDDDQRRLAKALDLRLGETDLPLVIQDKQFDAQGRLHYRPNMHESMMGWLGDIVLANLTPNAVLSVTPRIYRLRVLNGCQPASHAVQGRTDPPGRRQRTQDRTVDADDELSDQRAQLSDGRDRVRAGRGGRLACFAGRGAVRPLHVRSASVEARAFDQGSLTLRLTRATCARP